MEQGRRWSLDAALKKAARAGVRSKETDIARGSCLDVVPTSYLHSTSYCAYEEMYSTIAAAVAAVAHQSHHITHLLRT
ncbi:hypothetical protein NPX13_g126 [Xylaria arbuscula]|uniref:Uncharacterized protein n=1 Tax=Xylaria arbuscula TaxID=114810 RepID=A0A9W8TS47_9PEZI|nr:hypothetical protein NPX13_g126 [Xylaria arbuscula]